jgi:hypothetical protein
VLAGNLGPNVKSTLTEPFLKRLQKAGDDNEFFTQEEF